MLKILYVYSIIISFILICKIVTDVKCFIFTKRERYTAYLICLAPILNIILGLYLFIIYFNWIQYIETKNRINKYIGGIEC